MGAGSVVRRSVLVRALVGVTALLLSGIAVSATAAVSTGGTSPLPPPGGCLETGQATSACNDLHDASLPWRVAVSPDGTHAYVADYTAQRILLLDRDRGTGAMTQKPGTAGCVGASSATCKADSLGSVSGLAISPDGKQLYVVSASLGRLFVFDVEPTTGALTRKAGTAGCLSVTGDGGACATGRALLNAWQLQVSADGKNVYVVAGTGGGIAVFARNLTTGVLTQLAGTSGCITATGSEGCFADPRVTSGSALAMPADDSAVVTAHSSGAVLWWNRSGDGSLSVSPSTGCAAAAVLPGCTTVPGLAGVANLAAAGTRVYAAAADRVVVLDRLSGSAPTAVGCAAAVDNAFGCAPVRGFEALPVVAPSSDGAHLYLGTRALNRLRGAVIALTTSPLAQVEGPGGCRFSGTPAPSGCAETVGLTSVQSIILSPDNRFVVVTTGNEYAPGTANVTSLKRDRSAPVCTNRSVVVGKNNPRSLPLVCTDADGDPLMLSIVSGPGRGSLGAVNQSTDRVMFTPESNFLGKTSFRYRATSASGVQSAPAMYTVTVAGCPGYTGASGRHWIGTSRSETITGSGVRDVICGLGGNDVLRGLGGNDLLLGAGGNDTLVGGAGDDSLVGGTGLDTCRGGTGKNVKQGCER